VFQKSKKQAEIVNRIRWLAKMAGVAVILINHAADVIDKRRGSSGRTIVPTLGQAW
jgi:ABC-type branched-subunit amino acid transport system ATPase component